MTQAIASDALIIGAGPTGLFTAFELGLLGISAHIVDALPYAGGQCIELYPDKPIYDVPGTPATTGRKLVSSLLEQIKPFDTPLHLNQQVMSLAQQADGRFLVATTAGQTFSVKTLFIAAGVGAFLPKKLSVPGLDALEGKQLFYHPNQINQIKHVDHISHQPHAKRQRITIVGSEDAAVDAALALAHSNHSVTLLHRRDVFKAAPDKLDAMRTLIADKKLNLCIGQIAGIEAPQGQLSALHITGVDGGTTDLAVDTLLVLQGLSPKLGPVAEWGLEIERKQLKVDTEKFQTNQVGIFAVGDVNTYPGKKKLILSGFHEATLAAFAAATIIFPDTPTQLQYTTTSTQLLQRLGKAQV